MKSLHKIVIVGGGAGGLELATRLGQALGKTGRPCGNRDVRPGRAGEMQRPECRSVRRGVDAR